MISRKRKDDSIVSLLIVDDSLVFRKFLGDLFARHSNFRIVGEAKNGIEALELILQLEPDVILLDLEMPLMDGQTTLQHLMIHRPTPAIVFSSLTSEGTARCFDTLKNGALDFICKDFIFQKNNPHIGEEFLIDKVLKAAQVIPRSRDPIFSAGSASTKTEESVTQVVFCEDCGNKEVVSIVGSTPQKNITCSQCGDIIDLVMVSQSHHRRNSAITIIGGGEGSFFNLLEIVPKLDPDIGGGVIIVIQQDVHHVKKFAEYLDAISPITVVKAQEGVHIEDGNCYILAGSEKMAIKPYSAQVSLQKLAKGSCKDSVFDILLASASTIFKKKSAGIVLSGNDHEGERGMAILLKNGGRGRILDPVESFAKGTVNHVASACRQARKMSTPEIIKSINQMIQ